jgi:tetratricopeptide (TPR) repeat protein
MTHQGTSQESDTSFQDRSGNSRPFKKKLIPTALICLAVTLAYCPTFWGDFILDDKPFVKDNPYIRQFHGLGSYLLQADGIVPAQSGHRRSNYYRPLVNISYGIDAKIWGLNPFGFRLTNLLLHLAACLLVLKVLELQPIAKAGGYAAVLLFGLHPANTEAVSWIASRNNILVTVFSLASFIFYIKRSRGGSRWSGALALICFALALLCKEFALMLLPIIILYDRLLADPRPSFDRQVWGYAAYGGIILAYLALRRLALEAALPLPDTGHLRQSLFFAPFLIVYNLRLVLLPFGLHNFMVSYSDDYLGPAALYGFVGVGLLALFLWRNRRNKVPLFAILAFLVALLPVLNVVPTSAWSLVSMRWLYFPITLLTFLAAWGIQPLLRSQRSRFGLLVLGIITLYLGVYTYVLNDGLWRSETDFFENEVRAFKNYFYSGDLARAYHLRGDLEKASSYYEIAERHPSPHRGALLINHAGLLAETGKPRAALTHLEKAETFDLTTKERGILHNNKGAAHFKLKEHPKAINSFLKAVEFSPKEPTYWRNLSTAYQSAGEREEGIAALKRYRVLTEVPSAGEGNCTKTAVMASSQQISLQGRASDQFETTLRNRPSTHEGKPEISGVTH